jgi:carbon monoxide dehydrogenase subunit G
LSLPAARWLAHAREPGALQREKGAPRDADESLAVKLDGVLTLPGAPAAVWALLTDPARLARLLPGCRRLDPDGPDRFKAAVKFGIAAISGNYAGSLEFAEKRPPRSLVMKLDGKGLPGFVKGQGRIELLSKDGQTEVRYSGEAQVGGMIAGVGQRMLEGAARRIVQQFFEAAAAELKSAAPPDRVVAAGKAAKPKRKKG